MNLRLLFWAHEQTGERRLLDVALATAETIAHEYVRADGSTFQVVWFDPATGFVERKGTHQGHGVDSCWSRGQAWAIHGFVDTHISTGDVRFRDLATRLACSFMAGLPPDGVAPYDFLDPTPVTAPKDTSAQAIAASGMFALAQLGTGSERKARFADGLRLLAPLCERYLVEALGEESPRGLLRDGCYFLARDRGVGSELIFGDYYFVEALLRYLSFARWS